MRVLISILVVGLLAVVLTPSLAEEPMRDEDVVRMVIGGASDADIVAAIRSRPTAFDLSDEMVEELKIAGVSSDVIREMRRRQTEIDGPTEDEVALDEAAVEEDDGPSVLTIPITVRIGGKTAPDGKPAVLDFPTVAPGAVGDALELDTSPEDRALTSAAMFVLCSTSTHVPDHWRRESSLGRDFLTVPRHRLVSFHPDFEIVGEGPASRVRLTVPATIELPIETEVTHTLQIGVALEIGGRYYGGLVLSEPREFVLQPGGSVLGVEIDAPANGDAVGKFDIRFVD